MVSLEQLTAERLAEIIVPAAVIFAEEAEHVADLRRRAADTLRPILAAAQNAARENVQRTEVGTAESEGVGTPGDQPAK
jgi:hypothetical protein